MIATYTVHIYWSRVHDHFHFYNKTCTLDISTTCTHLGKCVMTRVLFSGSILSCSAVNLSISCLRITRKTELRKVRPKMSVASSFARLSQKTGTWQKHTHLNKKECVIRVTCAGVQWLSVSTWGWSLCPRESFWLRRILYSTILVFVNFSLKWSHEHI